LKDKGKGNGKSKSRSFDYSVHDETVNASAQDDTFNKVVKENRQRQEQLQKQLQNTGVLRCAQDDKGWWWVVKLS
jgi:hypothetical protein